MSDPLEDIENDELFSIVWEIRDILWPNGDVDHASWSPDTIQAIGDIFHERGLMPVKEE